MPRRNEKTRQDEIAGDMRFFYEIHDGHFNLYDRESKAQVRTQRDLCINTLSLLAQVPYTNRPEPLHLNNVRSSVEAAFSHIEFEQEKDHFSLTELFSGTRLIGIYDPKKLKVERLYLLL